VKKKNDDRMWAHSGGGVGERVELGAVAGDPESLHRGWVCFVRSRVAGDGRGKLLHVEREDEHAQSSADE
jgi:hypothetical protein